MSFESYTRHMPTLQRSTFWSDYMSGLKGWIEASFYIFWAKQLWGNLSAVDKPVEIREVSPFTQYRAVDVTMYDLIYGDEKVCVRSEIWCGLFQAVIDPPPTPCQGMSSTGLCTLTFSAEVAEGNISKSEPKTNQIKRKLTQATLQLDT